MSHATPHFDVFAGSLRGIEYEINPWMSVPSGRSAACASAMARLRQILLNTGVETPLRDPEPGLPDLVFTANAALIYRASSPFALPPSRAAEEENVFRSWFEPTASRSSSTAGHVIRRRRRRLLLRRHAVRRLPHAERRPWPSANRPQLGCRVIPVELVDPYYYHLDTCFCPLAPDWQPGFPVNFPVTTAALLVRELVAELIEVEPEEAKSFACNAVVVGHQE